MMLAIKSAAAIAHCAENTIRSACYRGYIDIARDGYRTIIDRDSFEAWLKARQKKPDGHCSTQEAAEHLGITQKQVQNLIAEGVLESQLSAPGSLRRRWVCIESLETLDLTRAKRHPNCRRCGLIPEPHEPPLNEEHHCHYCELEVATGRVYPSLMVVNLQPACKNGRVNGGG